MGHTGHQMPPAQAQLRHDTTRTAVAPAVVCFATPKSHGDELFSARTAARVAEIAG